MSADWRQMQNLVGREFIATTEETRENWMEAYIPETELPLVRATIEKAIQTKSIFELEHRVIRLDGSIGWTFSRAIPVLDGQGEIVEWLGSASDVTEKKRAEEKLREQKATLDFTLESAQVGDWDLELIQDTSRRSLRHDQCFGYDTPIPEKDWGFEVFLQHVHPEDRPGIERQFREAVRQLKDWHFECRVVWPDQSVHWIGTHGSIYRTEEGKATRMLGIVANITERKEAEQVLREAKDRLANQAAELERTVGERTTALRETVGELEAFSYSIAHDMRAPLRAMQSFASLLGPECGDQISASGKDYIRRINTSAARMDRLIQDVLNYSRIVRTTLPLIRVDVQKLLGEIVESYPHLQPVHAEILLEGSFPHVLAHEAALTQCISNLLGNAVKFVAPGVPARVRVWAETRHHRVRLFFEDNGVGIKPEAHEKIFEMFQRLNVNYDGTGIGLAIVKKAIERMGGSVGLESEPGRGSTFWLDLTPATTEDE